MNGLNAALREQECDLVLTDYDRRAPMAWWPKPRLTRARPPRPNVAARTIMLGRLTNPEPLLEPLADCDRES